MARVDKKARKASAIAAAQAANETRDAAGRILHDALVAIEGLGVDAFVFMVGETSSFLEGSQCAIDKAFAAAGWALIQHRAEREGSSGHRIDGGMDLPLN